MTGEKLLEFEPRPIPESPEPTKPTLTEADVVQFKSIAKSSSRAVLESFFLEDLEGVVIIAKSPTKGWLYNWSREIPALDFIGRLELVKMLMVHACVGEEEEDD